jgi:hypothetical protein
MYERIAQGRRVGEPRYFLSQSLEAWRPKTQRVRMLLPLLLASRAPPPPAGTPTSPVLAAFSPLLGAPAFLRLHVKLKHESTALC